MKEKRVFAHLLTWFQTQSYSNKWEMWQSNYKGSTHNPDHILDNGKRDIAALSYPLIGPYDSNDPDVIEYQLLTMKLAGIDGVIIDWDGRSINRYRHDGLMNVLPKVKQFDMKLIICFEEWSGYWPVSETDTRKQQIDKAIAELKWLHDTILTTNVYQQIDGKYPVFVFRKIASHWFSSGEWEYIKKATDKLNIDYLFNDVYDESFHNVADGYYTWVSGFNEDTNLNDLDHYHNQIHTYMSTLKTLPQNKTFVGSVVPGFNDTPVNGWGDGTRIAPRYNLKRYRASWDYIKKYNVDFVQIVTWNDWNEGSQIEPCDYYGYTYIAETKKQISIFKNKDLKNNNDILQYPLWLYELRKKSSKKDILDDIALLLKEGKYEQAKNKLLFIKEK